MPLQKKYQIRQTKIYNKKVELYNFIKYSLHTVLLTALDRCEGNLFLKDTYKEQIQLTNKLKKVKYLLKKYIFYMM